MNVLDLIIAVILVLGAIRGFHKGFFHEIAMLVGLVAGVFIAIMVSDKVASIAEELFGWNLQVVKIVAFILIFIIVVMLIRLLGKALTTLFDALMLGFINRLAGVAVGLLKWALLLAIVFNIIAFLDQHHRLLSEKVIEGSMLYGPLNAFLNLFLEFINYENMPEAIAMMQHAGRSLM